MGQYTDQNEEVSSDVLLFLMLKVVPKVIKATEFSAEFGSVFELACLKASAFDFLVVLQQVFPQLTNDKKMRDLVETVLSTFLEN